MSKIFYDHLISLEKLEKEINKLTDSPEEKYELWQLVDEMVHHRIIGSILESITPEAQPKFLKKLSKGPHKAKILDYLKSIRADIEKVIILEAAKLEKELLDDLRESVRQEY